MTDLKYLNGQVALINHTPDDNRTNISIRLANAGATIVINVPAMEQIEEVIGKYKKYGIRVIGCSFDVTNKANAREKIQLIEREAGPVNIFINMPEDIRSSII